MYLYVPSALRSHLLHPILLSSALIYFQSRKRLSTKSYNLQEYIKFTSSPILCHC